METTFKQIFRTILLILGFTAVASSCASDVKMVEKTQNQNHLKFALKLPAQSLQRGDEDKSELIDANNLTLLLFKEGVFYKDCNLKADHIKELPQITSDREYELKIEIPRNNETVDFVLIANVPKESFSLKENSTTKTEFYKQLTFDIPTNGEWKPSYIPMWGELPNKVLTEDLGTRFDEPLYIRLVRAVTRIDLMFNEDNDFFDIEEAYLYNTHAKFSVSPFVGNYTHENNKVIINNPSVPSNVNYNGGDITLSKEEKEQLIDKPLKLSIHKDREGNFLTFIPEQVNAEENTYNPFIVLGIRDKKEQNSTQLTYYKAYFHVKKPNENKDSNLGSPVNLLRNHRYLINIKKVNGNGFATPKESAIQKEAGLINIEVIIWNDNINKGYVSGSNYFGVEDTHIEFQKHTAGQSYSFIIQTNIEDLENDMLIKWEDSATGKEFFDYKIDNSGQIKTITVRTIKDNMLSHVIKNKLIINAVGNRFIIDVALSTSEPMYTIIQSSIKSVGVFDINQNLETKAETGLKMTLKIDKDIFASQIGKTIEIKTDTQDGIYFSCKDIISEGTKEGDNSGFVKSNEDGNYYREILVKAHGSSSLRNKKYFSIIENSLLKSFCTTTLQMAYRAKKIIVAGKDFNYGWGASGRASMLSILWDQNYGLKANSTVKIPSFIDIENKNAQGTYPERSTYKRYAADKVKYEDMKEILKDVDIFIYGAFLNLTEKNKSGETSGDLLADFLVNKNGVVIAMDETTDSAAELINALYRALGRKEGKTYKLNLNSYEIKASIGGIYPIVTQVGDPIFDGPFNINGERVKYWGEDATNTRTIIGVPEEDIVVYSRAPFAGLEDSYDNLGLTMFRHTKVNLFFSGDGGFTSQSGNSTSSTICPFWVKKYVSADLRKDLDKTGDYTPLYKPKYGKKDINEGVNQVGNAIIFSNTLAWALEKAEFEGRNPEN